MSTSTSLKKSAIATAITAFFALGIAGSASAVTFDFSGTIGGDNQTYEIEGSYSVDEDILLQVDTAEPGDIFTNVLDFFELKLDGTTIFSGVPSSRLSQSGGQAGPLFYTTYAFTIGGSYAGESFLFAIGVNGTASNCVSQGCSGAALLGGVLPPIGRYGYSGIITQQPESVPEPSVAIALTTIAAAMLLRKRQQSA